MNYGTSYFRSREDAIAYYKTYEGLYAERAVARKLAAHEIHLGKPPLKMGEKLLLNKEEGRYFIQS